MPAHTFGEYVYFKDNENIPNIHHKVFILSQESNFYITALLKIMEGNCYHCQHCLLKYD